MPVCIIAQHVFEAGVFARFKYARNSKIYSEETRKTEITLAVVEIVSVIV